MQSESPHKEVTDAPVRILGIGGSIRAESVNLMVLRTMLGIAESLGAETVLADVHSMQLPIFNQYLPMDQQPAKLLWLLREVQQADGFIICSPTYLGSLSGAVKNTLDSLHLGHDQPGTYFEGRPVALASFGYHGPENVLHSLAFVTRVMGATLIPEGVVVSGNALNADQTAVEDSSTLAAMQAHVEHLVMTARGMRMMRRFS